MNLRQATRDWCQQVGRYLRALPAMFRVGVAGALTWRIEIITWMIFDPLLLIAFPFIWVAIAQSQGGTIADWHVAEIIQYYLLFGVGMQIVKPHPMLEISEQITDGSMASQLIRPMSSFFRTLIWELTYKVVYILFLLIPMAIIFWLCRNYLTTLDPKLLLLSLPLFGLGFMIEFAASYLFGLFTFWTEHPQGLQSLYWVVTGVVGGLYAPVDFFPPIMQTIIRALPFYGVLQFPTNVAIGRIPFGSVAFSQGLVHQLVWLVVLSMIVFYVWRWGVRRYVSAGQ